MTQPWTTTTRPADILPAADSRTDWDAAMARLQALADAAPREPGECSRRPATIPRGVQVLTPEDIEAAVKLWEETRAVPRSIAANPAAYLVSMARNLNAHSAYPIRKQWYRVVSHVLFVTDRWPTEKDLMDAARDVVKDDAI